MNYSTIVVVCNDGKFYEFPHDRNVPIRDNVLKLGVKIEHIQELRTRNQHDEKFLCYGRQLA